MRDPGNEVAKYFETIHYEESAFCAIKSIFRVKSRCSNKRSETDYK